MFSVSWPVALRLYTFFSVFAVHNHHTYRTCTCCVQFFFLFICLSSDFKLQRILTLCAAKLKDHSCDAILFLFFLWELQKNETDPKEWWTESHWCFWFCGFIESTGLVVVLSRWDNFVPIGEVFQNVSKQNHKHFWETSCAIATMKSTKTFLKAGW